MNKNTLFQSLDNNHVIPDDAAKISSSLDLLTAQVVGALIAERLIDYGGQPGQTIEYLSIVIAGSLVKALAQVDTVEMEAFWK